MHNVTTSKYVPVLFLTDGSKKRIDPQPTRGEAVLAGRELFDATDDAAGWTVRKEDDHA